jgi:hypothetical protein
VRLGALARSPGRSDARLRPPVPERWMNHPAAPAQPEVAQTGPFRRFALLQIVDAGGALSMSVCCRRVRVWPSSGLSGPPKQRARLC